MPNMLFRHSEALNGRAMFIVAGAPACMEDLKTAGIENFIHVRVKRIGNFERIQR